MTDLGGGSLLYQLDNGSTEEAGARRTTFLEAGSSRYKCEVSIEGVDIASLLRTFLANDGTNGQLRGGEEILSSLKHASQNSKGVYSIRYRTLELPWPLSDRLVLVIV